MKSTELRRPPPKAATSPSSVQTSAHSHAHVAVDSKSDDKPYTDPVCGMKAAAIRKSQRRMKVRLIIFVALVVTQNLLLIHSVI